MPPYSGAARGPERVLLIQLRRIGDAVLVTPALDALGDAWPAARIHLLTGEPIPGLFRGDGRVHAVWPRPRRRDLFGLSRALRAERFDLCLDFQSLPWTALLARRTGAFTVGFARTYRNAVYHRAVRLEDHRGSDYAADHKLDLLRAVGLAPRLTPPRLVPPPPSEDAWRGAGERPRVALVPVSRRAHKRWGFAAFAETARLLHRETGACFLIAGGPGEPEPLAAVAGELSGIPHAIRIFTELPAFAAALAASDLFLGNDNGPRHLAVALGRPTVAYFGTQNPTHWTPPGDDRHCVLWDPRRASGRPVRGDLRLVPDRPEEAAAAAAALLEPVRR